MINLFYHLKYCKSVHYIQYSLKYGVEGDKRKEGEVWGLYLQVVKYGEREIWEWDHPQVDMITTH